MMQSSMRIHRYSLGAFLIILLASMGFILSQDITLGIQGASKKKNSSSSQVTYQLPVGQSARINLSMSHILSKHKPEIPGLDKLDVGLESTSQEMRMTSQGTQVALQYMFEVSAKKEGLITLGPVTVEHDGKTLVSNTLVLEIISPPTARDVAQSGKTVPYFSQLEVPKTTVVIGESLPFTCRMYSLEPITRAQLNKPDISGFVIKQVGEAERHEVEVKGVDYHVIEVPYVLTPLMLGEHTIEPFVWSVFLARAPRHHLGGTLTSFFGGGYQEHRVGSNQLTIMVKELPDYAYHVDGIGLFDKVSLEVNQKKARVGDLISVTITIQGRGNLDQLAEPSLILPDAFVSFDSTKSIDTAGDRNGLSGSVTFKQLIRASVSGEYEIYAQHMHFYDPDKHAYYTRSTSPIILTISGGVATVDVDNQPPTAAKIDNKILNKSSIVDDIHFIIQKPTSVSCGSWGLPCWLFLILLLLPICWVFSSCISTGILRLKQRMSRKKDCYSKEYLHKQLASYVSSKELKKIYTLFKSLFSAKKEIPIESFSIEYVQDVLAKDGWNHQEIADFSIFLQQCESFAFAPSLCQTIDTKMFVERAHFWIDKITQPDTNIGT